MGQDAQALADKLQAKTTEFKANVTASAAAGKADVDAYLQQAKRQAEKSKAAIQGKASTDKAEIDQKLAEIKDQLQAKGDEINSKVDQGKADLKSQQAHHDVEAAEKYASRALDAALYYIDESASALAEAQATRVKAAELNQAA